MHLFSDFGWGDDPKPKPKVVLQILDHCFYCNAELTNGICKNPECKLNRKASTIKAELSKKQKELQRLEAEPDLAANEFEKFFSGVDDVEAKLPKLIGLWWWEPLTSKQRMVLIDGLCDIHKRDVFNLTTKLEREVDGIHALAKPVKELKLLTDNIELVDPPGYQATAKYEPATRVTALDIRQNLNQAASSTNIKIDDTVVYNSFSGNGKLSGINFKECADFADYTDKKKEFEMGQFFTPDWLCKFITELIQPEPEARVADLCCGAGRFFNHMPCKVYGCEPDDRSCKIAKRLFNNNDEKINIKCSTMDDYYTTWGSLMDYAVGNPPFNLYDQCYNKDNPLISNNKQIVSQDSYVYHNNDVLKQGGTFVFITPKTWLTDELRHSKINKFIEKNFYFIAELELPDDTFSEYQISFPIKIIFLVKKIKGLEFTQEKFRGTREAFVVSDQYRWYHGLKKTLLRQHSLKRYLDHKENVVEIERENTINRKLRKTAFVIKQRSDKASEIIDKMKHEVLALEHVRKPWAMNTKQWEERKPTKLKILKKYQRIACKKRIKDLWIRICKDQHNIKITTSNSQASMVLNEWLQSMDWDTKKFPIWKCVVPHWDVACAKFLRIITELKHAKLSTKPSLNHPAGLEVEIKANFDWNKFIEKKRKQFGINRADLSKMETLYPKEYTANKTMLEQLSFPDKEHGTVKLLPHQSEDLAAILIKNRALLSWSMGLGKTIAGLIWAQQKGTKTLIVAPACNLIDPWQIEINQRFPDTNFLVITKRKDWGSFTGDERFLVVSLEALPTYEKLIAKYKFNTLILDESDNIKNKASKRAKCLKKLARGCKKILCMTGTPTRNNAVEIYNQAELLLNNSAAMLCTVEHVLEYDRYMKEYRKVKNPLYMEPYPAYGGLANFRKSFSPKKTTVFGAEKSTQKIYNKKELEEFMLPIRMTRIFEEEKPRIDKIFGHIKTGDEKDSEIHQELVKMTPEEGKVYEYILDKFVAELMEYFQAKGHDSKTAKMLIIVRQIMSLLQAVSHPWTFSVYEGGEMTSKMTRSQEIFVEAQANSRKVLFGSPWVPTIDYYEKYFSERFPIFRIKSEMSKIKRANVIKEFREHDGFTVLMGTIGCLKSGLSIPEASVVITDSLTWNWSTYNQFISRAIRLTSKRKVDVYALCNEGSFDVNVFSLMMKKEKINQYIRRGIEHGDTEFMDKFNANTDIFEAAVQLVKTRLNGKTISRIEWQNPGVISEAASETE